MCGAERVEAELPASIAFGQLPQRVQIARCWAKGVLVRAAAGRILAGERNLGMHDTSTPDRRWPDAKTDERSVAAVALDLGDDKLEPRAHDYHALPLDAKTVGPIQRTVRSTSKRLRRGLRRRAHSTRRTSARIASVTPMGVRSS